MGVCNGIFSSCSLGGYAMETKYVCPRFVVHVARPSTFGWCRCHLGTSIVYDTVTNLSWSVDIRTHGIMSVVDNVLSEPWQASLEIGREVPKAIREDACVVRGLHVLFCGRC